MIENRPPALWSFEEVVDRELEVVDRHLEASVPRVTAARPHVHRTTEKRLSGGGRGRPGSELGGPGSERPRRLGAGRAAAAVDDSPRRCLLSGSSWVERSVASRGVEYGHGANRINPTLRRVTGRGVEY